jgi:hypothetical protein
MTATAPALNQQQLRLGQVLLAAGPVTQELLQAELQSSGKSASALGKALAQSGFVAEADLVRVAIQRHRIPKINIKSTNIPLKTIALLPENVARASKALAIDKIGNILVVVTPNILNIEGIRGLRSHTGLHLSIIQCGTDGFDQALDGYYKRLSQAPDVAAAAAAEMGRPAPAAPAALAGIPALVANADEMAGAVPLNGQGYTNLSARWQHFFGSSAPLEAAETLL